MTVILFCTYSSGQDTLFSFIRKIQIDDQGAAGAIDGCAFSTAGDIVASSDNQGYTKLFQVSDGAFLRQVKHSESVVSGPNGETNAIHFSMDDRYFVTGMNNTGAKVWETATGDLVENIGHGSSTDGAAFAPGGQWLAVALNSQAAVYNVGDWSFIGDFVMGNGEVNSIDWTSDASYMAICGTGGGGQIIRTSDWTKEHQIDFGISAVKTIRVSPSDELVAIGGQNGRARVYRMSDAAMVADLLHKTDAVCLPGDDNDGDQPNIEAVEWSWEGRYFFTGGQYDGVMRAWRAADWSLVGWVNAQEYSRQVEFIAVNQNNVVAAGGDEGYLYMFQFNLPSPKNPVLPADAGQVVIEAEDNDANVPQGGYRWQVADEPAASGGKVLKALADDGVSSTDKQSDFQTYDPMKDSPKLDFRIYIPQQGTWYVWVLGKGAGADVDGLHAGLGGRETSSADRIKLGSTDWTWSKATVDGPDASIVISQADTVTFNLWMQQSGVEIDKILLTTDPNYMPSDMGPAADARGAASATGKVFGAGLGDIYLRASGASIFITAPEMGNVTCDLLNVRGQLIRRLHSGTLRAGRHEFPLTVREAGKGLHLVRLKSRMRHETRKAMLVE